MNHRTYSQILASIRITNPDNTDPDTNPDPDPNPYRDSGRQKTCLGGGMHCSSASSVQNAFAELVQSVLLCGSCVCFELVSGSLFKVRERGRCRCVRGEIVCEKSPFKMIPKEGDNND